MEKKEQKQRNNEGGITLIALVVTIIILLILAGITLSLVLSDGGLIDKSKEAIAEHKSAQEKEQGELSEAAGMMKNLIDGLGGTGGTTSNPSIIEGVTGPTGKPLPEAVVGTEHDTVQGEDSLGNPVVIPGGFKFAGSEGDTVEDGIIIEDDEQNQFVWIPVSNTNEDGTGLIKKEDGTTVEITLGRYTFATSYPGTPTTPKQLGANHSERSESTKIDSWYYEDTNEQKRPNGGEGAKNLAEFITSVEKNHGYYLSRYEASFGSGTAPEGSYSRTVEKIMTNQKPSSKLSTGNSESSMSYTSGTLWNFITQGDASKVSQNMYSEGDSEAEYVESDLVNSYAWDTAIVYIQAMGNVNYANKKDGNGTLKNTGATGDKVCNIYDMAGNVMEWTTEYSTKPDNGNSPCVIRSGYFNSIISTAHRIFGVTTMASNGYRVSSSFIFKGAL